jgi:hypothetical protein
MRDKTTHLLSSMQLSSVLPGAFALPLLLVLALPACGGNEGTGGGGSGASAGAGGTAGAGGSAGAGGGGAPADPCNFPHDDEIPVTEVQGLNNALLAAQPGTLIRLAPGTYAGTFDLDVPGTADKPIILCGPREAILDGQDQMLATTVRVRADYQVLSGFTVTNGRKGVVLQNADMVRLSDLLVHTIGEQAIQIREMSSGTTVEWCEIRDTGLTDPTNAEGIYVGSSAMSWPAPDMPDASDNTKILNNKIGPGVKTEHVDLKEGTTGGEVRGNTFDGMGITGENFEDSWVNVAGNGYLFAGNKGTNAPKNGFETRLATMGWGNDNVFENNVAEVNGAGYGFFIAMGSTGNVVKCNNTATGAMQGLSNVDCTQ